MTPEDISQIRDEITRYGVDQAWKGYILELAEALEQAWAALDQAFEDNLNLTAKLEDDMNAREATLFHEHTRERWARMLYDIASGSLSHEEVYLAMADALLADVLVQVRHWESDIDGWSCPDEHHELDKKIIEDCKWAGGRCLFNE